MKKRSLFAAVAMLIVSAVVLTSATYAWFASGSKADIDTIGASISNSDGTLLISVDSTNWGTNLEYADWFPGGTLITGNKVPSTNDATSGYAVLTPVSFDAPNGVFVGGSLSQITDSSSANYKDFQFTAASATSGWIDLKYYVKSTAACNITLTPTFSSDINFIYGAITATVDSTTTTNVVGKSTATGYVPVVATSGTAMDTNTANGIVDAAEDTGNTLLKQGASNTVVPLTGTAKNLTFTYSQAMADAETAVECHIIIWAEGQDASCTGKVTSQDAEMTVALEKTAIA